MMAVLFLLFLVSIFSMWIKIENLSMIVAFITLILMAFMLAYHATSTIGINY